MKPQDPQTGTPIVGPDDPHLCLAPGPELVEGAADLTELPPEILAYLPVELPSRRWLIEVA